MDKDSAKKRGWIKNFAIIFLIILLLLTFFSNTILTYSLPEVSAQYPQWSSLSSAVKMSGTIKANESYKVMFENDKEGTVVQSRKVRSVYVKDGDYVEKDQDIIALEGGMSAELEAVQKEYDELKKSYDLAIIGDNVSHLQSTKGLEELQAQYDEAKETLDKLKAGYDKAMSGAETDEEKAARAEELKKQKRSLEARILELGGKIEEVEGKIAAAKEILGTSAEGTLSAAQNEFTVIKNTYESLVLQENTLALQKAEYEKKLADMRTANGLVNELKSLESQIVYDPEAGAINADVFEKISVVKEKLVFLGYVSSQDYAGADDVELFKAERIYSDINAQYETAQKDLSDYAETFNKAQEKVEILKNKEAASNNIGEYTTLLGVYNEQKDTLEKELENLSSPDDIESQIKAAEANVKGLETDLNIRYAEASQSNQSTYLERQSQKKRLDELAAKIEEYKNAPETLSVKAPISGRIVGIYKVVGESVTSGETVANIEISDKGYVCEVTISSDQARKISTNSPVSIVNSWWYSPNVEVSIKQIRSDVQSQGKNKIVVFELKGDVYEGQEINLSVGDKSSSYDSVLPNSAIREDNSGKFVLVVDSKNTPLGVRYKARRVEIEILASDDTSSAVSGIMGGEFVITNATVPISDGQMVRLADK